MSGDSRYDALIVGARCAGAATALLLARAGLRVLMIDRSRHGADTVSTHALMRGGVLQLARWGLLDAVRKSGAPPVGRTTFYYSGRPLAVDIPPRPPVDALYAPRRTTLDPLLVDAARAAGAEVRHGTRLVELTRDRGGRVTGAVLTGVGREEPVRAGLVIGADGARSAVARLVGARATATGRHAAATLFGYYDGLAIDGYHWYYEREVSAGVIPTDGGHVVFAVMTPDRMAAAGAARVSLFDEVVRRAAPDLAARLARARREGGLRRFAGLPGHLRQPWGPGWALVGDAGYFKDPITAHGITDALRDAELLARAVAAGDARALDDYRTVRDELSMDLFRITDEIASLSWTLDRVAELHRALSAEMRREVSHLAALDEPRAARPASGAPQIAAENGDWNPP
jgi:flavin-dependent dehydrogenase